jgi:hypothetical protein
LNQDGDGLSPAARLSDPGSGQVIRQSVNAAVRRDDAGVFIARMLRDRRNVHIARNLAGADQRDVDDISH